MKKDNDITKQGTEAILQLFQVFQQISDASAKNCIQDMPGQIVQLSNHVSQIETRQQQSVFCTESIKQQLENMASTNKLLENASETVLLLGKEHHEEHVIQPVVRSLFPVLDLIEDARKHWTSSEQVIELLNGIWSQMEQFLAIYDVHITKHTTGDSYNPKAMKAIKWEFTPEEHLEKSVAQSLQIGFTLGQTRILRTETVSLFKYQPLQTDSINLNERTEK